MFSYSILPISYSSSKNYYILLLCSSKNKVNTVYSCHSMIPVHRFNCEGGV